MLCMCLIVVCVCVREVASVCATTPRYQCAAALHVFVGCSCSLSVKAYLHTYICMYIFVYRKVVWYGTLLPSAFGVQNSSSKILQGNRQRQHTRQFAHCCPPLLCASHLLCARQLYSLLSTPSLCSPPSTCQANFLIAFNPVSVQPTLWSRLPGVQHSSPENAQGASHTAVSCLARAAHLPGERVEGQGSKST